MTHQLRKKKHKKIKLNKIKMKRVKTEKWIMKKSGVGGVHVVGANAKVMG